MVLSLGSNGPLVRQLEQRLKDLGLYTGAIDGIFGGGVQSATKNLQTARGLPVNGVVDEATWQLLFPDQTSIENQMLARPIASRCLALTGSFETSAGAPECFSALRGNFDGQGISFGTLQWNLGQATLQPMLWAMLDQHADVMQSVFHDNLGGLQTMLAGPVENQLNWAASIQDRNTFTVYEPWKGLFSALGRTPEFQAVQLAHATNYQRTALELCAEYKVVTERALALMFDIAVQNGSIDDKTRTCILTDFAKLPSNSDPLASEVTRLQIISNRRAEAGKATSVEDIRRRKLTVANGQGTVHGISYDLEQQFGIRLTPFDSSQT